jgi:hypothetical protein
MAVYQKEWLQKPASELVDMASEIAATKFVYDEISGGGYPSDYMEYLLRFDNPLEVLKDQWISEQTVDYSEELSHALGLFRTRAMRNRTMPSIRNMLLFLIEDEQSLYGNFLSATSTQHLI